MLWFAKDLPNICSLAGLLCALLGIYFAILQHFSIAVIAMIWAVLFDWGDGVIARNMKDRTKKQGKFGLLPLNAKEGEYLLASLGDFGEMWFNIGYWYDNFFDAGTLDQDEVVAYAYLGAQRQAHRPPTCGRKPSANENIYAEDNISKKTPLLAVGFQVGASVTRRPPLQTRT